MRLKLNFSFSINRNLINNAARTVIIILANCNAKRPSGNSRDHRWGVRAASGKAKTGPAGIIARFASSAVWPDYDTYQASTEREIPLFVLDPSA